MFVYNVFMCLLHTNFENIFRVEIRSLKKFGIVPSKSVIYAPENYLSLIIKLQLLSIVNFSFK